MIFVGGKLIRVAHISAVTPTFGGTNILMRDGTWIFVEVACHDVCLEILEAERP